MIYSMFTIQSLSLSLNLLFVLQFWFPKYKGSSPLPLRLNQFNPLGIIPCTLSLSVYIKHDNKYVVVCDYSRLFLPFSDIYRGFENPSSKRSIIVIFGHLCHSLVSVFCSSFPFYQLQTGYWTNASVFLQFSLFSCLIFTKCMHCTFFAVKSQYRREHFPCKEF